MEDSGVTSFNSSGSADLSLDALDLSSSTTNDMSAGARSSSNRDTQLESRTAGSEQVLVSASTVVETPTLIHQQPEGYSSEGELQR